jgi:hypothetical protein
MRAARHAGLVEYILSLATEKAYARCFCFRLRTKVLSAECLVKEIFVVFG